MHNYKITFSGKRKRNYCKRKCSIEGLGSRLAHCHILRPFFKVSCILACTVYLYKGPSREAFICSMSLFVSCLVAWCRFEYCLCVRIWVADFCVKSLLSFAEYFWQVCLFSCVAECYYLSILMIILCTVLAQCRAFGVVQFL